MVKIAALSFLSINFCLNALPTDSLGVENSCQIDSFSYQPTEQLTYKAYYNLGFIWAGVGMVEFKTKPAKLEGRDVYHACATARNLKAYNWLYEVRDTYQTYLDQYTYKPVRFERDVHEGKFTIDYQYDFDYDNNQVYLHHMMRREKMRHEDEYVDINDCTYDIMSAFYYARSIDYSQYEVGENIPFEVFIDGKSYNVAVKYLGKGTAKTKVGKFNCIKFSPELIEGDLFADDDNIVVYATDDDNKIPVYIEGDLSFGKMKIYLREAEGLKFDMEAKIGK